MAETDAALDGGPRDFVYARNSGPTQVAFEDAVAALEGAEVALCFSSGMAALHAALLAVAHSGGHMVVGEALYGTTLRLARWLDANVDITIHTADLTDLEATRLLIDEVEPTALVCEVLTNPTSRVIDLPTIAMMVHAVGGQVVVDNTFATPYLLRPLEVGADLVVHSVTKFINGHGDVLAGVLAGPSDLCRVAYEQRVLMGAMMSSFDAWLALRGLRTLPLRMRQACESAAQVAAWLKEQPGVSRVAYPGDPDHADHAVAKRLFREGAFGAMLAFELADGDQERAFAFIEALGLCRPVTSLGDLVTLVSHPATASHRSLTPEERAAQGISEGLIRVSVGVEEADDIIADLAQAFQAL
jgi:cystathionine beta-lyase/cystathionine gamma-synthase